MRSELESLFGELGKLASEKRKLIAFLGAVNVGERNPLYRHARQTAYHLGCNGHDALTGGGPGIMEAVNLGIQEGCGRSIEIVEDKFKNSRQETRNYKKMTSKHHILRRHALLTAPDVVVFYPGAKGTLDELLNLEMYLQEGIIERLPVFLVQSRRQLTSVLEGPNSKPYWESLGEFCKHHMNGYSSENGLKGEIVNIEDTPGRELAEKIIRSLK